METRKKIKSSPADKVFTVCNTIFMILFIIITLYPILNTLALAFNEGTDALRGGIYLIPRKWTLKNFITVLQKDNLITGAYITVARTLIGTFTALITNAILAFIVSRKRFLFKKQLSLFWVITMYVNGGAGYFTIFTKIISPLCKPVYATVALFVAVGQWNSWFDAMLYNRMNANLTTLQYELMKLLSSVTNQGASAEAMKNATGSVTPETVRAAASILTMLPIICIYPFLQRYFVTGLTLGGVKE